MLRGGWGFAAVLCAGVTIVRAFCSGDGDFRLKTGVFGAGILGFEAACWCARIRGFGGASARGFCCVWWVGGSDGGGFGLVGETPGGAVALDAAVERVAFDGGEAGFGDGVTQAVDGHFLVG